MKHYIWKTLSTKLVLNNKWYKVSKNTVEIAPKKIINDYYLGEFPNIVLIVAITKEGRVILVRQYKYGADEILLEIPAGYIEQGEQPLAAAKRELFEETGYKARHWKKLGFFYSNTSKERGNENYLLLALDAYKAGEQKLDTTENIELVLLPKEHVLKKVYAGEIKVAAVALTLILALNPKRKGPL